MAIVKVKDVATASSGQSVGAAQFTFAVPAAGIAAGNTLLVMGGTGTVSAVTDSKGNAYTIRATGTTVIFLADSVITTPLVSGDTITVTRTATGNLKALCVEYSGMDPASPFDAAAAASTTSVNVSGGSITTTRANDLVLGLFHGIVFTPDVGTPQITTPGALFTNETGVAISSGGGLDGYGFDWESKFAPSVGNQTASATWSYGLAAVAGVTAAYKAAFQKFSTVI